MRQNESTADLVIGQTEQIIDSVPPPELPPSIRLPDLLDRLNMTKGMTQLNCASCWTLPCQWLRINVLGTSVANGCGGAERVVTQSVDGMLPKGVHLSGACPAIF